MKVRSVIVLGVLALGVGCGGSAPPPESAEQSNEVKAERLLERARAEKNPELYERLVDRFADTQAASEARSEYAALLLAGGKKALAEKSWSVATERAQAARIYGDTQQTREARKLLTDIESARADEVAATISALLSTGKCEEAVDATAKAVSGNVAASYRAAIQQRTDEGLGACLMGGVRARLASGGVDEARASLETPAVTRALSEKAYQQAFQGLQEFVVEREIAPLDAAIAKQDFAGAFAELDALVEQGVLTDAEREAGARLLRAKMARLLAAEAAEAVEDRRAVRGLAAFDAGVTAAGWTTRPHEIDEWQERLETAAQCERVDCRLASPEPVYVLGAPHVMSRTDVADDSGKALRHGERVWRLGTGRGWALIATTEPAKAGTRAGQLSAASGWIPSDRVRAQDTRLVMPPGADAVGMRVWGPLDEGAKDYLLGVVTAVRGKQAEVKRLSDGQTVEVPLARLRVGVLEPGMKVRAFCGGAFNPVDAKIDKVLEEGQTARVRLTCAIGTKEGIEMASSLRAEPRSLP